MDYKVLIVEDDPMVSLINEQYVNRNKAFRVVKKCKDGKSALGNSISKSKGALKTSAKYRLNEDKTAFSETVASRARV
jgi:hypothetical protein